MNLRYPDLPQQVWHDELLDAIRTLGFDPNCVRSLRIEQRAVIVELLLSNDDGKRFAAGDEPATVTVRLPVTDRVFVIKDDEGTMLDPEADVA